MLGCEAGMEIVAQCEELKEALKILPDVRPDVVLAGVENVSRRTERFLSVLLEGMSCGQLVVLGHDREGTAGRRLTRLGVRAYLSKGVPLRYLVSVVCMVHFYGRRAAGGRDPDEAAGNGRPVVLSAREREIVELVAKAMTNAQIGRELHITEGTVKRHLSNVFTKLQAVSRIDAVNKAAAACLID
ncbi:DNA-binding response regulator [Streptomyces humidus]|uniref:DNA-binding response regulator n=1 Tax=Streptomyces humidus TaxID=52259 RepID=A0A918FZG9_9ACTN|nr:response regulator transcription factor [Streptomyces humidus]GGS05575.1 DNA-binding response regulator [Streptomyces humidus]